MTQGNSYYSTIDTTSLFGVPDSINDSILSKESQAIFQDDPANFFFSFHETKPARTELSEKGKPISSKNYDWMVAVLLFSIVLLALIRFSFNKFLNRVVDSLINSQTSTNLFLEKNLRNLRGSIFMNLLFFVNGALFLVQYSVYILSINQKTALLFLYFFFGLMGLYATKFIVIRTIGYIFNGKRESKEYWHSVFIYNKNLGLFLLPIILSAPFIAKHAVPLLLNIGILLALSLYILRLTRGLKILFRQHVSIFYMILYLCALEILPLLVILKFLNSL